MKKNPRSDRADHSQPILVSPDCGLRGKPLVAGRYLCAEHAQLALECSHVYRMKNGAPGGGRAWMTDPTKKEKVNV